MNCAKAARHVMKGRNGMVSSGHALGSLAGVKILQEGGNAVDAALDAAFVMAVVKPEERTVAAGVTNLVRTGAWAVGPALAGTFMQTVSLATPLFLGAGMKLVYDALLYAAFKKVRPPEERR